jgi:flagellar assembly protein FliH
VIFTKSVFKKSEAEKVVVNYTPHKFPMKITETAKDFHSQQISHPQSSFRMDPILANHTGVSELERVSLEEKVESEALLRVKDLQESAYQQAYKIGLEEGREHALQTYSTEIIEQVKSVSELLQSFESIKKDLVNSNEAHLIRIIYQIAKKLAMREIQNHDDTILAVLKDCIIDTQGDEKVSVRVSPQDFSYLQKFQEIAGPDFEFLKKVKIIDSSDITTGGCIIETNYGVVDASVEKRVDKLWLAVADKIPKIKESFEVKTEPEGDV